MERFEWWHPSRLPPDLAHRPLSDLGSEEIDPETGAYNVYFFDVAPDRVVWGLTVRLVRDLLERLGAAPGPGAGT